MGREGYCTGGIQNQTKPKKPKSRTGKHGRKFQRSPKTAAAATDRGSSVAGERKRMHRGGGARG